MFDDILERENTFVGNKNNKFIKKIDIFPKGLVHVFGQKLAIFPKELVHGFGKKNSNFSIFLF